VQDDDGLDGLILAMVAALSQAEQTELHGCGLTSMGLAVPQLSTLFLTLFLVS
jgi:hypothetical protein